MSVEPTERERGRACQSSPDEGMRPQVPESEAARCAVLLAEYELLREARAGSHIGSERRYANHLAVSAGLVALVALAVDKDAPEALGTVAWFASTAALLLGVATFVRMVDFYGSRHLYDEGLNRVREELRRIADLDRSVYTLPLGGGNIPVKRPRALYNQAALIGYLSSALLAGAVWTWLENWAASAGAGVLSAILHIGYQWWRQGQFADK